MRDTLYDTKRMNAPKWHTEHEELNQSQRDAIARIKEEMVAIVLAYSGVAKVVTATHLYLIDRHGQTTFHSRRRLPR